jgi:hypothetical protein
MDRVRLAACGNDDEADAPFAELHQIQDDKVPGCLADCASHRGGGPDQKAAELNRGGSQFAVLELKAVGFCRLIATIVVRQSEPDSHNSGDYGRVTIAFRTPVMRI